MPCEWRKTKNLPIAEVWWRNNRPSALDITVSPCSSHCSERDPWLLSQPIITVGLGIGMRQMCPIVMMEISGWHRVQGPPIWWASQVIPMIMIHRPIHSSLRDMGAWWWGQWWKRLQVRNIRARMCPWCRRYRWMLRKHLLAHKVMNCMKNSQAYLDLNQT
jgi:hypothetical protein